MRQEIEAGIEVAYTLAGIKELGLFGTSMSFLFKLKLYFHVSFYNCNK
jgi:hypothetical protein